MPTLSSSILHQDSPFGSILWSLLVTFGNKVLQDLANSQPIFSCTVSCCVHLQIEPHLAAKRVRFSASGDIVDPVFDVFNLNDRYGTFKLEKVLASVQNDFDPRLLVFSRLI